MIKLVTVVCQDRVVYINQDMPTMRLSEVNPGLYPSEPNILWSASLPPFTRPRPSRS